MCTFLGAHFTTKCETKGKNIKVDKLR
jgi:hypothetical protein